MVQDYLVAPNDGTVTGGDGTRGHRFWVGARHGAVTRGGVYILGLAELLSRRVMLRPIAARCLHRTTLDLERGQLI